MILDMDPEGLAETAELVSSAELLTIQCDFTNHASLEDAYLQMTSHFLVLDEVTLLLQFSSTTADTLGIGKFQWKSHCNERFQTLIIA